MFTRKELEHAVEALMSIKEDGPHDPFFGICFNISCGRGNHLIPGYHIVEEFSSDWDEHTGNPDYPVPGDDVEFRELWKNKARWRLVDYLIERITAELQSMSE